MSLAVLLLPLVAAFLILPFPVAFLVLFRTGDAQLFPG